MRSIKRLQMILLPLLFAAGLFFLVLLCAMPLRAVPYLHLDFGRIGLKTVLLAAIALLCLAFALLSAVYTVLNLREKITGLLIPIGVFLVLCAGCWLCFTRAVRPLAYTYTVSASALDSERFQTRKVQVLPAYAELHLTGYCLYNDGEYVSERVTATYPRYDMTRERSRLSGLGLTPFLSGDWLCYEFTEDGMLYQAALNTRTRQAVYLRCTDAENLPANSPQPMTEDAPASARPTQGQTEAPTEAESENSSGSAA